MPKDKSVRVHMIPVFQLVADDGRYVARTLELPQAQRLKEAFDAANAPCRIMERVAMLMPEAFRHNGDSE